ncbi:hypothetical protein T05_1572 [Trichinella murrelli]|uniref:Uncharacterized protein n=1 Tax=Trichinella murrelli TaxID=144512 RepID=A0A0V0UC10_9BILA|nr:hypothetical protein T05_1572 [Trichinella murrelli]
MITCLKLKKEIQGDMSDCDHFMKGYYSSAPHYCVLLSLHVCNMAPVVYLLNYLHNAALFDHKRLISFSQ